jgi:hypothetical protein
VTDNLAHPLGRRLLGFFLGRAASRYRVFAGAILLARRLPKLAATVSMSESNNLAILAGYPR